MKLQQLLLGSAAVFAASVWTGMELARPAKQLPRPRPGDEQRGGDGGAGSCAFDRLASVYDSVIGSEERYMLYGLLRWWLLRDAQGDVLEISAGTGRNLPHYSYEKLNSLTLTDVSAPMLARARDKYFDELRLQYRQPQLAVKFMLADVQVMAAQAGQAPRAVLLPVSARSGGSSAAGSAGGGQQQQLQQQQAAAGPKSVWRFKQQQRTQQGASSSGSSSDNSSSSSSSSSSAAEQQAEASSRPSSSSSSPRLAPSEAAGRACSCSSSTSSSGVGVTESSTFAPGSFDVVVDTFGLCSCDDPVLALRQAAALLRPGGRLLLLEHGRSSFAWLNGFMDDRAAAHYSTYGCWYNRDILAILQQAGLQADSLSRWHFGTSYVIVATPAAASEAA